MMINIKSLQNEIQREISNAKKKHYENNIDGLRTNNEGKWHRHVKNRGFVKYG